MGTDILVRDLDLVRQGRPCSRRVEVVARHHIGVPSGTRRFATSVVPGRMEQPLPSPDEEKRECIPSWSIWAGKARGPRLRSGREVVV